MKTLIDDPSEQHTIDAVLNGDRDEFRILVERYKNIVYGMIMKQVSDVTLASELSQDVFVRAYNNLRTYRAESKFSTWIIQIALNVTNSYFTSRRYKQSLLNESFDQSVHDVPVKDSDSAQNRELMLQKLRYGVGKLTPKLREVMVLCGLEGRSYEEAASILSIPVGTVRSRLNAARLSLKQHLLNEGEGI